MGIFGRKTEEKEVVKKQDTDKQKAVETKTSKKDKKEKVQDYTSTVSAFDVIIAPIITEKSHSMAKDHKYTFRVKKTVTKKDVKKAVEETYGVSVVDVNIVVVKPKRRTVKYDRGYQKLFKKAIVTVGESDKIAIFEGV